MSHRVRIFRLALSLGALLSFWVAAWRQTGGISFAPLDDVYIYFDFARETARGNVLSWAPGGGFSSGATSPLYALLLSVFWGVGLRGESLFVGAALIAWAAIYDLTGSFGRLAGDRTFDRLWGAFLPVSLPLCVWSFASGMELAFFSALLGRAVVAVLKVGEVTAEARPRAQQWAGLWIALVALGRPECLPLALGLVVATVLRSYSLSTLGSAVRASLPLVILVGGWSLVNFLLLGEVAAAGALRKMAWFDPYASHQDIALMGVTHVVRLWTEGLDGGFGGGAMTYLAFAVSLFGCVFVATRPAALALAFGALATFVLVAFNRTAPFQHFRYVVPVIVMLLLGVALSFRESVRRWPRARWAFAGLGLALVAVAAVPNWSKETELFGRAAKNIHDQQFKVGLLVAELAPRRVFVGDAGAIVYVVDRPAVDGLGLGGTDSMPFARASVHGVGAVVELIERLPSDQRPDVLAIYDAWWPGFSEFFGERLFSVRIADNIICGDAEKVVYRANFGSLEDRAALARGGPRLDIADLMDEADFGVTWTRPHNGVVHGGVHLRGGRPTYDASREISPEAGLSFRWPESADSLTFVLDPGEATRFEVRTGGEARSSSVPADSAAFREVVVVGPFEAGQPIEILAGEAAVRLGAIEAPPREREGTTHD